MNKLSTIMKKEGSKSFISSLIAIGLGLLFGFIIIVINSYINDTIRAAESQ